MDTIMPQNCNTCTMKNDRLNATRPPLLKTFYNCLKFKSESLGTILANMEKDLEQSNNLFYVCWMKKKQAETEYYYMYLACIFNT